LEVPGGGMGGSDQSIGQTVKHHMEEERKTKQIA
jgi:hypothetical protein